MSRFESERDPDEIQEQLSIIANPTVSNDSVTTALPFGEGYEQRDTKHADKSHKEETRYQPYSTTAPPQSSTSVSASERETAKLEENMAKTSPGYKVFVANLAFSVTARSLEDHMARGKFVKYLMSIYYLYHSWLCFELYYIQAPKWIITGRYYTNIIMCRLLYLIVSSPSLLLLLRLLLGNGVS